MPIQAARAKSIDEVRAILKDFDTRISTLRESTAALPSSNKQGQPLLTSAPLGPISLHTPYNPASGIPYATYARVQRITSVASCALADSTRRGYEAGIRRFLSYCAEHEVPAHLQFPADEIILSGYAASFAHRLGGSTAENAIAALKTWHAINNAPWRGGLRLTYTLKGVTRLAPASSLKPARPGVSLAHMETLARGLRLDVPLDAAVFAAAAVAFWCIVRVGELLGTSRRIHRPELFPSRHSLIGTPTNGEALYIHLPRTKTSQLSGAKIRVLQQRGVCDPFYALKNHIRVNNAVGPGDHLFSYRSSPDDPVRCLTKETFLTMCNNLWEAHGLERLSGHNFRIGGANTYIDAGVAPDIVKTMGGWKSGAYYKYWRKPEDKAAKHAQLIRLPAQREHLVRVGQGRLPSPAYAA
ncbi:hypothetical protein RSOLAG1IB_12156 [Rhizoctonia solani AG-1 IB]|uniref:DNA breaking-rejoining enzyme n=1 Tax=Thanatephorus cucumeris (strain AG1-IB / isolate 7/3/14) TaxID=1108050 RepID=M5C335_THACB|nr:hypothetical protein BN14_08471 [Rhizoctonia solani AG-1 IB]CEL58550.1 hypothetical protein RSOLAG1IB_12156 [Rhizoctonia solani AG-1 IB]